MSETGRDVLARWVRAGGHWEIVGEPGGARTTGAAGAEVIVGLITCDAGEERERVVVRRVDLPR